MSTEIEVLEEDTAKVFVNHKEVVKDMNGNWICREELTPAEQRALRRHLAAMGRRHGQNGQPGP